VTRRPLTLRRLVGLDRSGPPPPQTLAGAPLRPWTLPNAIGFVRLALIPVFLQVGLSRVRAPREGQDAPRRGRPGAAPAVLFAVIGAGDYADGIAARVTGQYSRLGAMMDPLTDRLLVICGALVCWRHRLLPRWALALLTVRELVTLALALRGQRRGLELRINWPGRIAVGIVIGALFFAMLGLRRLAQSMLCAGLALALIATGLYARAGLRARRA
jgi:phosphatidylglycerophosphate synthase